MFQTLLFMLLAANMEHGSVKVIQTGGTIDKDYPKSIGGYSFEIEEHAAEAILLKYSSISEQFHFCTVCKKDSQEIGPADRARLLQECQDTAARKIIITHGTDTMIETAAYLAKNILDKTIIVTGAFKPYVFKDTDAEFNIGVALGALQILENPGVFIAMCGRVIPWDVVKRHPETNMFS